MFRGKYYRKNVYAPGGSGACNERQHGTDQNLTQNARAPKHSTALQRPSGGPANYSGQFKNSGKQKFCWITGVTG
ncbi:hypothetical protein E2C01_100352 [Portunus trituberculatus]|uniref:Uncharacterized protein n=1 Tax=Portunus trituberculatus TaxID=210409 RepID=A0A5B7KD49_PORTR|nr:hypothetical protein [Portunus trituberculatus]